MAGDERVRDGTDGQQEGLGGPAGPVGFLSERGGSQWRVLSRRGA